MEDLPNPTTVFGLFFGPEKLFKNYSREEELLKVGFSRNYLKITHKTKNYYSVKRLFKNYSSGQKLLVIFFQMNNF